MDKRSSAATLAGCLFLAASLGVSALDLWSKEAVFDFLQVVNEGDPPRVISQERYKVLENWFWLEANYNYGAFSGWFSEHTEWLAVLSAVAVVVLVGIVVYHLRKYPRPELLFVLALGLLLGGTLGNLYDRAVLHAVRDWIRWFVVYDGKEHVWPNFNVADSAICTGVGLLIFLELRRWRREVKEAKAKSDAA